MNAQREPCVPPAVDPGIEALGATDRAQLAQRWLDRAQNELGTSTAFAELYRGLVALEAPPALLTTAASAVGDELRHAEICHAVAERYAGHALPWPTAAITAQPQFNGCSARESRVLHVVLHACLNEGVAAAYLGACLNEAESSCARSAVHALLEDEIRHARLGWAFLASATDADRSLVSAALPQLLVEVAGLWLNERDYPTQLRAGHGCLNLPALRRVFAEALKELILPGFDHVGVATDAAREKLASQAWLHG